MIKRRFQFSALLATTCIAAVPRVVLAQAADAPPAEAPPPADVAAAAPAAAPDAAPSEPKPAEPAAAPELAKAEVAASVAAPAQVVAPSAHEDSLPRAGYVPGYRGYVGVGMTPFIPRLGALPGGMTPSFGSSVPSDDWSFNFTGFMSASVRASMNTRENPRSGQSKTVFHSTPQNVEVYGSFNDTASTPGNWVGLLFQYGNRYVTANLSFDTHNPSRASGYEIIGSQYFISDTFLSLRVPPLGRLRVAWNVGFFSQPFGYLGQYGGGLYTPPLMGKVAGAGETVTAEYDLSDNVTLVLDDGFSGGNKTGKVPEGALNTGSTSFSDSSLPAAWVHHAHLGLRKKGETTLQVTAHFMTNWSQSDQIVPDLNDNPDTRQWDERYPKDGRIHVGGIEAKAISQTYGYLALGAAVIDAKNSYRLRGLSTYAGDGVSLTNDWFGGTTGGTGRLLLAGINYKFSLGSILRAPKPFWGDAPDLVVEAALQMASTKSDDPGFDGRFKQKAGLDVLYTFVPWLGVGLRADRIAPNSKDPEETFYALAPRLQFRSNWTSHETVTLKYSKWFYGEHTHSDGWDARPRAQLDDQMLALAFGDVVVSMAKQTRFNVTDRSAKEMRFRMKRGLKLSLLLLGACVSLPAHAQEQAPANERLGLAPGVPQADALPGGTQPAFGQPSSGPQDWRFDFHGFFTAPLRIGLNTRENPVGDQSKLVLHAPPVVPDDLETFSHTGVVPTPYAQMNFSYGNNIVTGNVFILARTANVSTGFFDPSSQMGINDVFLNFNLPDIGKDMHFEVNLGQFSNRYGVMGEYDEGRYGTPLIARTNGAGENIIGRFKLGDITLFVEQGFQGQSDKAPTGLVSDGWNGFADPNVGTSYVNHVHAGVGVKGLATVGLHYMNAFAQDDRATGPNGPDGSINILGGDLRLTLKRFGHFYAGASMVQAENARSVGRIVEVLNTRGGPGLMDNYLGPKSNGTGKLLIFGGQYDLSLARLLRTDDFKGDGPDIFLSLFALGTKITSDDANFDKFTKLKLGGEGTYSLLPWLAAGVRYDMVKPDDKYDSYNFAVLSPRVIFRTGWQAHDQVTLQYSHWFNGAYTTVRGGYPPKPDVTIVPDEDVVSLSASMWW